MTDKQGLVPIVTQEVGFAVQAEMSQTRGHQYFEELLQRLDHGDNPAIARFLYNLSMSLPEKSRSAVFYSGLGVYRLIESQAEADRMKE